LKRFLYNAIKLNTNTCRTDSQLSKCHR